ncbi:hypothetical protein AX761_21990 [Rhizobium sp. 58]|nr:hypothetical protein AX761_21990 [Rhizobium sp. 58]
MKTFDVTATIALPLAIIVEAVGPEISRALIAFRREEAKAKQAKAPEVALRQAVANVVKALNGYEHARQSAGERAAFDKLIASSKGLRAVFEEIQSKGRNQ